MNCFVLNYSFLLNGLTKIISYTYHLGTTKNTFAAPKSENRILNIKMLGGFLKNLWKTGVYFKILSQHKADNGKLPGRLLYFIDYVWLNGRKLWDLFDPDQ